MTRIDEGSREEEVAEGLKRRKTRYEMSRDRQVIMSRISNREALEEVHEIFPFPRCVPREKPE